MASEQAMGEHPVERKRGTQESNWQLRSFWNVRKAPLISSCVFASAHRRRLLTLRLAISCRLEA